MKILQCHSKGDKRFSPFYCQVEAFGLTRSIEDHYQCAKRFDGKPIPQSWREVKAWQKQGIEHIGFELPNGLWLPSDTKRTDDLAVQFYIALWYKYLRCHPDLIAIAREYEEFEDIFKGKFPFCQADVIKQVVKHGLESLSVLCQDFMKLSGRFVQQDLLRIERGIIAHQVNCQGKMGAGLARDIHRRYPIVFKQYKKACDLHTLKVGKIQLIKVSDTPLYLANLAGQVDYGIGQRYTDYEGLSLCLQKLYAKSQELSLTLYLPFGIGCGLAGGEWHIVCALILQHCPNAIICKN
jgi:O-acetyl-ADP-ribose deacetylase (regulator of RNase III)